MVRRVCWGARFVPVCLVAWAGWVASAPAADLTTLTLSPADAVIQSGGTQQMTAVGTFTDGSSAILNGGVGTQFAVPVSVDVTSHLAPAVSGSGEADHGYVTDIAIADLNGDGIGDAVALTGGGSNVMVFSGNADGSLSFANTVATVPGAMKLSLGDVDHDGNLDVAVASRMRYEVWVHLGASGGFGAGTAYPVVSHSDGEYDNGGSEDTVLADFNGDGHLDLAAVVSGAGWFSVRLGNGDGTFQPYTLYRPDEAYTLDGLAAGDLNTDGAPDLIAANASESKLVVRLNDGAGGFGPALTYPADKELEDVALGDFDEDGFLDVAASAWKDKATLLWFGDGAGNLGARTTLSAGGWNLTAGDLNADGHMDLALANWSSLSSGTVHWGTGTGGFPAQMTMGTGYTVSAAIGDTDGDGRPDLIVGGTGTLIKRRNLPVVPSPDWASSNPAAASVSGSGLVTGLSQGVAVIDATTVGITGSTTVTVQVIGNEPPFTQNIAKATNQDAPVAVTLLGADNQNDPLTYTVVTPPAHGTLAGTAPALTYTPNPGFYGTDSFTYLANDGTADSNVSTVTITVNMVDTAPPAVTPPANIVLEATDVTMFVTLGTATAVDAVDGPMPVTNDAPVQFALGVTLVTWSATDAAGNTGTATQTVTIQDTTPPVVTTPGNISLTVNAVPATVDIGQATATDTFTPVAITHDAPAGGYPAGDTIVTWTATDPNGNTATATQTISVVYTPPLPPAAQALQPGGFGIQYTDMVPQDATLAAFDERRFAIVTGFVNDLSDTPIAGAAARIHNQPEYGSSVTDAEGRYILVVNGGDQLTVDITYPDHLMVQRKVTPIWNEFALVETVTLTPLDTVATTITFDGNPNSRFAHRSSSYTDDNGTRSMTMVFAGDTTATAIDEAGASTALTGPITVRASEITRHDTLPGPLPAQSIFTYASDLTVDGVAPTSSVHFSQPVVMYVDNFLSLPTGDVVPIGYYDRVKAEWIGVPNGRVVTLLDTNGDTVVDALDGTGDGLADDLNGDGSPHDEVAGIAGNAAYPPGASYWRGVTDHFSSYDWNFPWSFMGDQIVPEVANPTITWNPCTQQQVATGSAVSCESGTYTDDIPLPGTDLFLHYRSDAGSGYRIPMTFPVIGDVVPSSLLGIAVSVNIAGKRYGGVLGPYANQHFSLSWDGTDLTGRQVKGPTYATIMVTYAYRIRLDSALRNYSAIAFGKRGVGVYGNTWSLVGYISRTLRAPVFHPPAAYFGIGEGWSLSNHHELAWDVVQRGDGTTVGGNTAYVDRVAGGRLPGAAAPDGAAAKDAALGIVWGLAVAGDGSIYYSDYGDHRIRKIGPDGVLSTVAGTGTAGYSGDGGDALLADIRSPGTLALAPDGTLYFACRTSNVLEGVVRRIDPDGTIHTVAGGGTGTTPATSVTLNSLSGLAWSPNGDVYFSSIYNSSGTLYRVDPEGNIFVEKSYPQAGISHLQVDDEENLYFAGGYPYQIRKIDPNGIETVVAGTGQSSFSNFYQPATSASFAGLTSMVVAPAGLVLAGNAGNLGGIYASMITAVTADGTYVPLAGIERAQNAPAPAADVAFRSLGAMAAGPDNTIYVVDNTAPSGVYGIYRLEFRNGKVPENPGELSVSDRDRNEKYVFDLAGTHLRTEDLDSGVMLETFAYDAQGDLASVTDRFGNATVVNRGATTTITGPDGDTTILTVTGNRLDGIQFADDTGYAFQYTPEGLLTGKTSPTGGVSVYSHDARGHVSQGQDAGGGVHLFDNVADTLTGATTATTTDPLGRAFSTHRATRGDRSEVATRTDKAGLVSTIGTLNDGLYLTGTLPDGTQTTTRKEYDTRYASERLRTRSLRLPSGKSLLLDTGVGYADSNLDGVPDQITRTAKRNNRTSTLVDNLLTGTLTATSPAGRVSTTVYDPATLLTTTTQVPGVAGVGFSHDARGRLTGTSQGAGADLRATTINYDAQGRVGSILDPYGTPVSFAYDAVGRVTSKTLKDGGIVSYTYDAGGNLTSVTPPGRTAHLFTYTPVGLEASYTPPDLGQGVTATVYSYNLAKELTAITRPDGQAVAFAYDAGARLSTVTTPRGITTYGYSAMDGNLATLTAPDGGVLSFTYDGSIPLSETWTAAPGVGVSGSVSVTLDADLRIGSQSVNGLHTVAFAYDADGLLTGAGQITLTRDIANGFLTGTTLGLATTARTHNAFGELASLSAAYNGAELFATQYTRDKLGRITQKVETVNGVTATYDYTYTGGRLTRVDRDGLLLAQYDHDANGNLFPASNVYDAQDRLISTPTASYTYTANGELATRTDAAGTTAYDYDLLGNLMAVSLPDATQIDYLVDARNRRIGKVVNGALVQGLLYGDQLNPVAELDATGAVVSRFVYGSRANVPDYMVRGGMTYRIISDHLGSPRLVVDVATGAIAQEMDYDAFGNVIQDTLPGFQPFGFAGGIYDTDTKLTRFGARDYDAEVGRWTAKDPIRFDGGDSNLYGYVLGDPVNGLDPLGLWVFDVGFSGGVRGVGVTGGVQVSSSGIFAYGGVGIGIGAGASVTIGSGDASPGTSISGTFHGGTGSVGAYGAYSVEPTTVSQSYSGGVGLGIGTGLAVTVTRTIPVYRFDGGYRAWFERTILDPINEAVYGIRPCGS